DCYINEGTNNNWVKFQLRGIKSNSYGIGSWVTLTLDDGESQTRYFSRETGYGSENAPEIHFGFGTMSGIASVEVVWPSGVVQSSINLESNQMYEVIEGREIKQIGK
ncbi:MAG TPA: ASPIC/UnbV domain-containing protein, partial [Eudoraea sp.]|nr:ASPIC/UnbV domain-containing protein [Eudoraea sp.]